MSRRLLSTDLDKIIKRIEEVKAYHCIVQDPEEPWNHIDKALWQLDKARIEAIINETVKE